MSVTMHEGIASSRRLGRGLMYRAQRWSRLVPLGEFVGLLMLLFLSRIQQTVVYRGIKIVPLHPYGREIAEEARGALELIYRRDPRRFARIQAHIRLIGVGNSKEQGFYHRTGRYCAIRRIVPTEDVDPRSLYGAVLVHEATHGLLDSKRFAHLKSTNARIERICRSEHERFLR